MELRKIVVIGAGTMGSGIAQWFAQQGLRVFLVDNSSEQRRRAEASITASWSKLLEKGKLTRDEFQACTSLLTIQEQSSTPRDADLVVEAIIEDLSIKKGLFENLDQYYDDATVFASNTSSFPIASIACALSPSRQRNFLGLHFFNPAPIMKLVEIIQGEASEPRLCQELYRWFEANGKAPALCKDSPGFIVNRVARNFYGEPLRILGAEDKSKMQEIDRILREAGGFKMGPFELMDLIGIDVNYSVTCSVWEAFDRAPRFAPHELQKKLVQENRLGRKTGRGYFRYD